MLKTITELRNEIYLFAGQNGSKYDLMMYNGGGVSPFDWTLDNCVDVIGCALNDYKSGDAVGVAQNFIRKEDAGFNVGGFVWIADGQNWTQTEPAVNRGAVLVRLGRAVAPDVVRIDLDIYYQL